MSQKLIVIGGNAAGLSAASKAKRLLPGLSVAVYEKSGFASYGACGLPYFAGDMIRDSRELIALTPEKLQAERDITVHLHHEAIRIDRAHKLVVVRRLEDGMEFGDSYDQLVIATGANPIRLPIPGADAANVLTLRTVEDGLALVERLKSARRAAVIGGGLIGLEVAEQLQLRGIAATVFESESRLLPMLPEAYSEIVLDEMQKHGVDIRLGSRVTELQAEKGLARRVSTQDGGQYETDVVLMSVGVRPNGRLAAEAGLAVNERGAIVVSDAMQTADPDIWACGDCVQMKNRLTGQPTYVPLGTTANKQGRVAGSNIGGRVVSFPGVLGSQATKLFDLYIGQAGLTYEQALLAGFPAAQSMIQKQDKPPYYPGASLTRICLTLDTSTGRLLGAQALGGEGTAGRINALAVAITAGMTVQAVSELDLVYAPPVAPVYDPILVAASQAAKLVEKE
ncbi:MAG: FAD-dependent oxidoreductase [Candidatus Pelethousia sp.]|nr:FAD-dependent oxidoreductase [Candidatus Pelethousia sp.]